MDGLCRAVVLSGLLHDARSTKSAMLLAIDVVAKEPRLRLHLRELITQGNVMPSATTLKRHRLRLAYL